MPAARLLAGVLWMAAAAPLLAQNGPVTSVAGQVVDAGTRAPLAGARVELVEVNRAVLTTSDGRFSFDGLGPGSYTLTVSRIGFIFVRRNVTVSAGVPLALTIPLASGTGTYTETVTVTGERVAEAGASVTSLDSAGLQTLRGVAADDPMRAIQALPGVVTGNDFRSEFSVRGSAQRQIGIVIDGVPVPLLLHTVQAAGDTGSIAMINTDILAGASLSAGTHPQRYGNWMGATLTFDVREGSRDRLGLRAAVSGTNASVVSEGPIGRSQRGSWLFSARKSYIDWLVRKIDPEITGTLGFFDMQGKVVYDLSSRQSLEVTAVTGRTSFHEPAASGLNELARAASRSLFTAAAWRFTAPSFVATSRASVVMNVFRNAGRSEQVQARGQTRLVSWRGDVSTVVRERWRTLAGADVTYETFGSTLNHFTRERGSIVVADRVTRDLSRLGAGIWGQVTRPFSTNGDVTIGARLAHDSRTSGPFISPWVLAKRSIGGFEMSIGAGHLHQTHSLEIAGDLAGSYRPEAAWTIDAGVSRRIAANFDLRVAAFARRETNVIRLIDELRWPGTTRDFASPIARFLRTLEGGSRGFDVVLERRGASWGTGWVGYSWAHTRHRDIITNERFDGDYDQRHTLNAFVERRLSYRFSVSAKLRTGSNLPVAGYFEGTPEPESELGRAAGLYLGSDRNSVRLPTYARLDLGASRTFTFSRSRLTLFVEVLNALGRRNLADNGISGGYFLSLIDGRVSGLVRPLIPRVPSAGLLVEF